MPVRCSAPDRACTSGSGGEVRAASGGDGASSPDEKVVLRIANWEEYIDEGGWDEEEIIELDDRAGTSILGENSMVEDFEQWYLDTYGVEVEVEYSTFGTNEDLYNQMTLEMSSIWSARRNTCL